MLNISLKLQSKPINNYQNNIFFEVAYGKDMGSVRSDKYIGMRV